MMSNVLTHLIEGCEVLGFGLICFWFITFAATHTPHTRSLQQSVVSVNVDEPSSVNSDIFETEPEKTKATTIEETTVRFVHEASIRDLKAIAKALTETTYPIKHYGTLKQPELIAAMLEEERLSYLVTLNLPEVASAHRAAAKSKAKQATTTVKPTRKTRNRSDRSK